MRPFDLMTWTSIVILVVGSSAVFLWFLRDAGSVLRGSDKDSDNPDGKVGSDPEVTPSDH